MSNLLDLYGVLPLPSTSDSEDSEESMLSETYNLGTFSLLDEESDMLLSNENDFQQSKTNDRMQASTECNQMYDQMDQKNSSSFETSSESIGDYESESSFIDKSSYNDVDDIPMEANVLQKEVEFLQAKVTYLTKRQVLRQKRKLEDTTVKEFNQLQSIAKVQYAMLQKAQSYLRKAPIHDIRLTLMSPFESHLQLPRNKLDRRKICLAVRDEKLNSVFKYVQYKSQEITGKHPEDLLDLPALDLRDSFTRFDKCYSCRFRLLRFNNVTVTSVVSQFIGDVNKWEDAVLAEKENLTDKPASDDESTDISCASDIRIKYDAVKSTYLNTRITTISPATSRSVSTYRSPSLGQSKRQKYNPMIEVDANVVIFCQLNFSDKTAVVCSEPVIRDDLYPYPPNKIRKDFSIGCVFQEGIDPITGQTFVIMKKFMFSRFHLLPHWFEALTDEIIFC